MILVILILVVGFVILALGLKPQQVIINHNYNVVNKPDQFRDRFKSLINNILNLNSDYYLTEISGSKVRIAKTFQGGGSIFMLYESNGVLLISWSFKDMFSEYSKTWKFPATESQTAIFNKLATDVRVAGKQQSLIPIY